MYDNVDADGDDDDDDDDDDDGKEVVWYVLMFASNRSFYNQLTFSFCFWFRGVSETGHVMMNGFF
jgi:hypothetical protein